MSIFKEHKTNADRSASDRRRHKQKIEKAIKDGVHDIVAEESIIGQDGKKKIKIPVKGIKQYRFIYGSNEDNKSVGSAPGKDIRRGQKIGKKDEKGKGKPGKPGNEPGEEFYEVEVTLEELAHYLFNDLQLPDLDKKKMQKILSEKYKRKGYRNYGINPRLDKKESMKKRIRRKQAAIRAGSISEDDDFSFHEDDLRFRHIKKDKKPTSNAVIFFIMDVSGSMTKNKKYLARSFFFLLYHFIRCKYEHTELVFVAHDTQPYETDEEKFFNRGSSGGTLVSPALEYVHTQALKRFHPDSWNIYAFHCSDGDNWPSDTDNAIKQSEKLRDLCQLYGYCEINPSDEKIKWLGKGETLQGIYEPLVDNTFKIVEINEKTDVWPAFKHFFGALQ